jgi:hypothetical protein
MFTTIDGERVFLSRLPAPIMRIVWIATTFVVVATTPICL